jgi:hypothetical protein
MHNFNSELPRKQAHAGSWMEPETYWEISDAAFACRVDSFRERVVELLATGTITVPIVSAQVAKVLAGNMSLAPLERACHEWLSSHEDAWTAGTRSFYLHSIFRISHYEFLVLVRSTPGKGIPEPMLSRLCKEASIRWTRYLKKKATELDQEQQSKKEIAESTNPEAVKEILLTMGD